ncbi:unnamed protein product [Brassicogethes aeneus]|uniref:protein-tyrosine-phosphatase n=1 Tax=Brassicogethes aeneus TaxID=1431903 RepID=A0A9P0AU05_BRAAE|nr:unnamed protein product [Brassicogethes aeneus]
MLSGHLICRNFVDASQCPSGYRLRIVDCLHAIYKALSFNFFNFVDFNMVEYDMRNTLQYGDLNWLVPRKFLAFIGPTENEFLNGRPPEFYVKYFLQNDVKTVIRLNNKFYDSNAFKTVGIEHYDLIFPDGSTPPREILFRFLEISETAPAAIGVHCKAGLGRTGSLIGAYLLKHYHMTAREAIAWMRICRPGSVIGYQQNWLEKIQGMMWSLGAEYRGKLGEPDKIPFHKYGIYSRKWPLDREKMIRAARKKIKSKLSHTRSESVSRASITTSKSTSISEKKTDKSPLKQIMKVIEQHKNTNSESSKRPISTGNNILKKVVFDDKLEKKRSRTRKNKSSTQGDKLNDIKVARQSSPDKFNKLGSLHKVAILFEKTQKR